MDNGEKISLLDMALKYGKRIHSIKDILYKA